MADEQKLGGIFGDLWDWFKGIFVGVADKAKIVLTALQPIIGGFVTQCEAIIEQVGETAFEALLTAAQVAAAEIEGEMPTASGLDKFNAFVAKLTAWAKTQGPTMIALLEAGIGPVLRIVLEMAIAAVKTAIVAGQKPQEIKATLLKFGRL